MIILAGALGVLIFGMLALILASASSAIYASIMGIHYTSSDQPPGIELFLLFWLFFLIGLAIFFSWREDRRFNKDLKK